MFNKNHLFAMAKHALNPKSPATEVLLPFYYLKLEEDKIYVIDITQKMYLWRYIDIYIYAVNIDADEFNNEVVSRLYLAKKNMNIMTCNGIILILRGVQTSSRNHWHFLIMMAIAISLKDSLLLLNCWFKDHESLWKLPNDKIT